MNVTPETDRENLGRHYMSLAIQYGHIKLQEGLSLYTAAGLKAIGRNEEELKSFFGPEAAFFFVAGKTVFECFDPLHVLDCMEGERENAICGNVLPISYKATAGRETMGINGTGANG